MFMRETIFSSEKSGSLGIHIYGLCPCKNFAQIFTCFHQTSISDANLGVILLYDGGQNRRVVRGKYSSVVSAPAAITKPQAVVAAGL